MQTLVITIIVMLVLAGVSINAIIGDNGVITNAQNANFMSGMVAFEEWLQEEYVGYADEVADNNDVNKPLFLHSKMNNSLLLKDGVRDYIISNGKVYYLVDKNCSYIPKEIRDGLKRGNTTAEYAKYTRLEDVYGITKDLKVYYCENGLEGVVGNLENYDVDPNAKAEGVSKNADLTNALTSILTNNGVEVDSRKGLTLANVATVKNLNIDGSNPSQSNVTSIEGIGDLKNLQTLTLSNLTLTSLNGLEGIPNLYYLYLENTTVGDFKALSNVINLQYLYLYLPSTIDKDTANNQVEFLGQGLKNASGLTQLEYFGISRK